MIEDEQILLQNLSSDLLDSYTYVINQTQYKHKDDHLAQSQIHEKKFITEKWNQRKYYVDWNEADNHQYFTKNIVEDIQDSSTIENVKDKQDSPDFNKQYQQVNYHDLNNKLELALNLIKSNNRNKEIKYKEKRSQSNEPRKQREMKCLTKTGFGFKGTQAKERKQSMNYRVKTQSEEESFVQRQNPFQQTKMDKYQTHHIIAEEKEHGSIKENFKENALRYKFLDYIALWQEKKEKRIQERIQKEMKLSMQGVTFTPEINAKSREIMKKKGAITPIYEREYREKKRELTQRFNVDQKNHRIKF